VTVWTIDAEPWSGGEEVARRLAEGADVPLVDGQFSVALALALGTTVAGARSLEHTAAGWFVRRGLLLAGSTRVAPEAMQELDRLDRCGPELERTAREAARAPCVILGRAAYVALASHPGARHVRIRAPRDWRARHLAAERCISLRRARREVVRADRRRRATARRIFGHDVRDVAPFHLVCDRSRLSEDAIVDVLLLLGGRALTTEPAGELARSAPL
jgi:cytidylate kinase